MRRRLSIDAICHLIAALFLRGYPAIAEVAQLLGLSSRTLQRRLNEAGVSYSALIDRCRCQAACAYLEHTERPIHEIAAALGCRDASSFSRAFRRWTGNAPRACRDQSRG